MIWKTLMSILLLAGASAKLCAQEKPKWSMLSKADATFNMNEGSINHRHKIWLEQGNTMTVELYSYKSYQKLQDLEGLLTQARADLAFVDDTIAQCPECSYRIDYLIGLSGMKSFRIQRYEPKGTFLYQKKNDHELRPFKSESDTLRITVSGTVEEGGRCQVTFLLNRFSNLDSLLAQKGRINGIIDTFRKTAAPKRRADKKWDWAYESTIFIRKGWKDTSKNIIDFRPHRVVKEIWDFGEHRTAFGFQPNIGAGLLRDKIAPFGEVGINYRLPQTRGQKVSTILGLSASAYFGFEKGTDGNYTVNDNWFINAEVGDDGESRFTDYITTTRLTLGVGYLVSQKGNYFQNTTMKFFMSMRIKNGITISPEIITTDNFKQVFPGITLKVF